MPVGLGPSVPVPSRSGCPVRQISRRIRSRSSSRCARSSSSAEVKTLTLRGPSGSVDSSGPGSVSSGPSVWSVSSYGVLKIGSYVARSCGKCLQVRGNRTNILKPTYGDVRLISKDSVCGSRCE